MPLPRLSEKDDWIKPFRRQVAITCGDGWYIRNNRGRMRLNVPRPLPTPAGTNN